VYEDESIPFLSMVLKGVMPVYSEYVNFEANKQEFFLKMVETGTYPSFYITKESSANLIYTNWLNYFVYQSTPYDIKKVEERE
jgi:homoserine trans-succinylase